MGPDTGVRIFRKNLVSIQLNVIIAAHMFPGEVQPLHPEVDVTDWIRPRINAQLYFWLALHPLPNRLLCSVGGFPITHDHFVANREQALDALSPAEIQIVSVSDADVTAKSAHAFT